ncbi:MAG: choice-of-anchor D domain-containing protein [Sedimentisphaerales bacterium]|nr:choice-of-anchor D domain-containing protein [Sedimentisphaerales bacterium]
MRSLHRRRKRYITSRKSPLHLETLTCRCLLSADLVGAAGGADAGLLDFLEAPGRGYGIADCTFADPAAFDDWDYWAVEETIHGTDCLDTIPASLADLYPSESQASQSGYVLYLDFDGAQVYSRMGDFWLGSSSVEIPAYDLGVYGWAGREQESIDYILDFVREDYAAYNITITTQEPLGGEYSTIYVGGDNGWFSPSSNVIGVATYDIGNHDPSNYGFAFPDELGIYYNYCGGSLKNFSEYLANLITHEAGHNFGANHIDDPSATMNPYLALTPRRTMFGSGPIPASSSTQDTQSLFGTNLGYAHGPDDYGDLLSQAQTITANGQISGLLERRDDVDVFTFTAGGDGTVSIDIDTPDGANLDSLLRVYRNGDGQLLAENDDAYGQLDSYVSLEVAQGEAYTIYVSSALNSSSGSYILRIELEALPDEPALQVVDSIGDPQDHALDFGSLILGESASSTLTLGNIGSADLIISQITAGGSVTIEPASLPLNGSDDITLAPGQELSVQVTCQPGEIGIFARTITLVSNDPDEPLVSIQLLAQVEPPAPDIDAADNLEFGSLPRGQSGQRLLQIGNQGQDTLEILDIQATEPFGWEAAGVDLPVWLAPGESLSLTVTVSADQRGVWEGELSIVSNDPDEPVVQVDLSVQIVGGVLAVHESAQQADDGQIDFGPVRVGQVSSLPVILENGGDADLTIQSISAGGGFELDTVLLAGDETDDIILAAGQSLTVYASYTPEQLESAAGWLEISCDDPEGPQAQITLEATGVGGVLLASEADSQPDGIRPAGSYQVGQEYDLAAWELTNQGTDLLTVSLAWAEGIHFQLLGPATIILQPNETVLVEVRLDTQLARTLSDTLTLTADDLDQTQVELLFTADAYAQVKAGQSYRFVDHTGDVVTVSATGQTIACVTVGRADQPDIASITVVQSDEQDSLRINVKGSGQTRLGELTGAGDLKSIQAPQVNLAGAGIAWNGQLRQLNLGMVMADADIAFAAAEKATCRLGEISGDSQISIDGALQSFSAARFLAGRLQAGGIGRMTVGEGLLGEVELAGGSLERLSVRRGDLAGSVSAAGRIGSVQVANGDLSGRIEAAGGIDLVLVGHGELNGVLRSGLTIDTIRAEQIIQAEISAPLRIEKIRVKENMQDSLISIGYDPAPAGSKFAILAANEVDALLGTLRIGGTFAGSTVAVGVAPDAEGSFIHGSAHTASGTIGKVVLEHVQTDNADDPFGLVACDGIERLRIDRTAVQTDYHQNDFYITVLK